MRLTTRGVTTFDLDPDSYSKMMMEIRELVTELATRLLTQQITQELLVQIKDDVLRAIDYQNIAQSLDYAQVINYTRSGIVNHLMTDERFSVRLMRLVGDATVGVTNEAVERVTAIMESKSNNNSDL